MKETTVAIEGMRIAVLGAGSLGWMLAAHTAHAGFLTALEDLFPSNLERAQSGIRKHLLEPTNSHGVSAAEVEAALARITFVSTIEGAVREADLALDCVPDELESKLEIFSLLDRMAPPRTIFCTPTRALGIADIASCTYRADRCVAVRPLLDGGTDDRYLLATTGEVVLAYSHWTRPDVLAIVTAFWRQLGKSVTTEYDGSFAPPGTMPPADM
jgi:3-hydroxybutyryl-CoA dehydrogenase